MTESVSRLKEQNALLMENHRSLYERCFGSSLAQIDQNNISVAPSPSVFPDALFSSDRTSRAVCSAQTSEPLQ